jgi:di- and tripeptidase
MILARGISKNESDEEMLITGGGDGSIKLWNLHQQSCGISEEHSLENGDNSVLSMAKDGTILYCGMLEGDINVWDLDTRQLVRNVKAHVQDVLTISVGGGYIFSAGASGSVRVRPLLKLEWTDC